MKFGKCTPRKILTKKLNMPGWEIYRDSVYGMYALHNELGLDISLMEWNITLNNPKLGSILESIRVDLAKVEEEKRRSKELFGERPMEDLKRNLQQPSQC